MTRPVRTLFVLALCACNRAPAEPISATADSVSKPTPSAAVDPAPKRCIINTPLDPPPKALPATNFPPDPQAVPPLAKVATVSIPDPAAIVEI